MSTKLTFEAPADLSVGRVTIQNEAGVVGDWVATPGKKALELKQTPPGIYTAEIAPVGQRPRSFVFEVRPEVANTVVSPLFSVLVAGGNTAAFSGVENARSALEVVQKWKRVPTDAPPTQLQKSTSREATVWTTGASMGAGSAKVLCVGLSQDELVDHVRGWRPYTDGDPTVELNEGGLNILIDSSRDYKDTHSRLRLSMALEGVRLERLMVPLFKGGVRVAFRASPLTTADISIHVTPLDPERRALTQALQASGEEVAAVRSDVLRGGGIERFVGGIDEDPWAAMVAALIMIRFPDVFGPKPVSLAPRLLEHIHWASDAHIIMARHLLAFPPGDDEGRRTVAEQALKALARAKTIGAPYFIYANQLMGEILGGLAALTELDKALAERARLLLEVWRSGLPFQRTAGAVFSWLMSDPTSPKVMVYRDTRGNLDERHERILFRGQVDLVRISIIPASQDTQDTQDTRDTQDTAPPKTLGTRDRTMAFAASERIDGSGVLLSSVANLRSPAMAGAPALRRPIIFEEDGNKGRFGGQAARGGFRLSATFSSSPVSSWVDVHLTVRADLSIPASYSEVVEFFLHASFNPSRLSTTFRGHEATVTVRAWGGFTVGAWLPSRQVELECDLAELPDVPRIIREL